MVADRWIAVIAARQRGLITREQLRSCGLGEGAIAHRLAAGRLHRIWRGVFLVGHAVPPPLAPELAVLLACGPDAVLSHQSAAAVWAFAATSVPFHVTLPGRDLRRRRDLVPHRARLQPDDLRTRHGLRLTSPARTLIDLAAVLDEPALARAVNEARVLGLVDTDDLTERAAGRRGATTLRALLEPPGFTRSEAEKKLTALLRRAGLEPTALNTRVAGHEVDALFAAERLVVEIDGYASHGTRRAFERDRRKDQIVVAAGYRVVRITWRQIRDEPEAVAARLGAALAQATRWAESHA